MSEQPVRSRTLAGFVAELRRRNVLRGGLLYIAAVWALAQGIAQLAPVFDAPVWITRWFVIAAAAGFPGWLVFSWFYAITSHGIRRASNAEPAAPATALPRQPADAAAALAAPPKSIAVLPFVNMSSDKEQEYFSDGISEELLNLLTQVPQLQVTARTSSFSFKGKDVAIPEIARQLGVAHVLEGSVRKAGEQVRITAQLIDAASGSHRWSRTWDRRFADIFTIQDEIAADIVAQLKVTLLGEAPKARTTDPAAYAMYLQAVQLGRLVTPEAFEQSNTLFRQVLEIDPMFAPAWSELGRNFFNLGSLNLQPAKVGFAQARDAALRALAIDPRQAMAHALLGFVTLYGDQDLAGAVRHVEQALVFAPSDPELLGNCATLLGSLGRLDEALALREALVRLDPVSVKALHSLGRSYSFGGRYDEALACFRTVLRLNPTRAVTHFEIGIVLLLQGDPSSALAAFQTEPSRNRRTGLPMAYFALGRQAEADVAMKELIEQDAAECAYDIAFAHAFCGQVDEAFAWLDRAVERQDPGLAQIPTETLFNPIRQDPRWLPFLRRIHRAPEQLAQIPFKVPLPQAGGAG